MRGFAALALTMLLFGGVMRAQQPLPPIGDSAGRVTFRVLPETVTVGQPFVVSLRAIPRPGRVAMAPPVPDTGGIVEPLDPAVIARRGDTLLVRYRLIAWEPGVLTIPLAPVLMTRDSSEMPVPVEIRVVVASVLPADTARRVPKDARDLFAAQVPWWAGWWRWMLALLAALVAMYLLYRWRTRVRAVTADVLTPRQKAEGAFARLDARQLLAAGEGGRHVTLAAEVLRQYLADIEPTMVLSLTNAELLMAARLISAMPVRQLAQLLEQTDAVRFSGTGVDAEAVRRVSGLARELVRDIDRLRTAADRQVA